MWKRRRKRGGGEGRKSEGQLRSFGSKPRSICRDRAVMRIPRLQKARERVDDQASPQGRQGTHLRELLDGKEGVELSLRLGKSVGIGRVDEENDSVNLGEVVPPQTTSCKSESKKVQLCAWTDVERRKGTAGKRRAS